MAVLRVCGGWCICIAPPRAHASRVQPLHRAPRRSARLALPLIKTAALLITHADLAGVPVTGGGGASSSGSKAAAGSPAVSAGGVALPCSFAAGVLQLLKAELKGCGDVGKLLVGVALLAQLACVRGCSDAALQTVMVMLVNRYPKVCLLWRGDAWRRWVRVRVCGGSAGARRLKHARDNAAASCCCLLRLRLCASGAPRHGGAAVPAAAGGAGRRRAGSSGGS
jgi:hypothetical protein